MYEARLRQIGLKSEELGLNQNIRKVSFMVKCKPQHKHLTNKRSKDHQVHEQKCLGTIVNEESESSEKNENRAGQKHFYENEKMHTSPENIRLNKKA